MSTIAELKARNAELLSALENAAAQFDYTVASMAQGHTVSMSSLQNCAAAIRNTVKAQPVNPNAGHVPAYPKGRWTP